MKEKEESGGGGYVRADQIDLKSLDEQLQRHLSRARTMEKRKSSSDGEDNADNYKYNQNNFGHRQLVFQRPLLGVGGYNNNYNNNHKLTTEVGRSRREWEIDPSKLIVKSVIARGTFGTVHRGIYDGQDVAVKLLDWGEEGHRSDAEIASLRAAFTQEVAVWHKLDHPNVTKFIGAAMGTSELSIQTENGHMGMPSNVCCVVVEYCPGGALKSFLIRSRRRKLAFKVVIQLSLDLARGLSYLHSQKIVHRDVKTENMLLDKSRTLKIADFGVARLEASNPNDMTGETGTLGYMAPEVLNGSPYNRKCDVYSFGICLWEIYCCDMPYPDLSFSEVTSAVVRQNLRPLPVSLCKRIQSVVTRFWWDDKEGQHKMAWTSWDTMTKPKAIGGLGFRDFLAFNDAFLGKLSWRILHNPDILLSRVLIGKYCHSESFLTVTEKSAVSHGWRGVLVGRDLLQQNIGWVVGNGNSIKAWQEPWLSATEQKRPMGPAPEGSENITVADLLMEDSMMWNEEKIQEIFPPWETTIRSIKPSITGAPDRIIWLGTESGEYTTKSGYHTAIQRRTETLEHQEENMELEWFKFVWNLHVSPKIKMFLWKLFQQAIPVGEILAARHITCDARCKRCGTPESTNHLFLHCPFAKKIWTLAPLVNGFEYSGLIDLNDVWLYLCGQNCLPPTGITTGQLAPWIIWQIWCARNQLCFEGKVISEEDILTRAVCQAREWLNAQDKKTSKPRSQVKQTPPPPNCTVVQTDAAWKASNNMAGFGWNLSDTEGRVSTFTGAESFVGSALAAEGLAMREALKKCKALGIKRLRCESDSAQLIKAINSNTPKPEIYGIVSDILELSSFFDVICFSWISRERNSIADELAKLGLLEVEAFMAIT